MSQKISQLPQRQQLRFSGYDYSSEGLYFVTIDCKNLECHFGKIKNTCVILNDFGKIALQEWKLIPHRFQNVQLHTFQIMPNHMHGIVELMKAGGNNTKRNWQSFLGSTPKPFLDSTPKNPHHLNSTREGASPSPTKSTSETSQTIVGEGLAPSRINNPSLSDIIGAYKSIVSNKCLDLHKQKYANSDRVPFLGKIWQRSFWDHIILDAPSFKSISRYIRNNPKKWNRL